MSVDAASGSLIGRSIANSSLAWPLRVAVLALAVALTAAAAQITVPVPFTAVPFTLTPLVVLLVGASLGSRLGFAAQVLYLLAGAAGLQVFVPSATLPPGAARLAGPTAGYLVAYPVAAFVTGWLSERGWDRRFVSSAAAMLIGLSIIFISGVSWLSFFTHSFTTALAQGFTPFIIPDIIKVAAAAAILPQAWKLLGKA